MNLIVLSLGSNIDREKNIRFAIQALTQHYGRLTVSPVYLTKAVGFVGPDFYNLVVAFRSQLTVCALSEINHQIEADAGRLRGVKSYGSRTLDIDILLYGDQDLQASGYDIPRDEIEKASYVLRPLLDLFPQGHHPVSGKSYAQLWREFAQTSNEGNNKSHKNCNQSCHNTEPDQGLNAPGLHIIEFDLGLDE